VTTLFSIVGMISCIAMLILLTLWGVSAAKQELRHIQVSREKSSLEILMAAYPDEVRRVLGDHRQSDMRRLAMAIRAADTARLTDDYLAITYRGHHYRVQDIDHIEIDVPTHGIVYELPVQTGYALLNEMLDAASKKAIKAPQQQTTIISQKTKQQNNNQHKTDWGKALKQGYLDYDPGKAPNGIVVKSTTDIDGTPLWEVTKA
jgi:hypothetical protein